MACALFVLQGGQCCAGCGEIFICGVEHEADVFGDGVCAEITGGGAAFAEDEGGLSCF
ncbi:hypothetical protein CHUV2995_00442 [Corynebacterium diphtheriae subsp. lausannense]|nr:hypothetical protein CHUV2995_00442 [Corynebacterium diphtheriae subsp. lausannense]